jgi:hypothetical protein
MHPIESHRHRAQPENVTCLDQNSAAGRLRAGPLATATELISIFPVNGSETGQQPYGHGGSIVLPSHSRPHALNNNHHD